MHATVGSPSSPYRTNEKTLLPASLASIQLNFSAAWSVRQNAGLSLYA